MHGHAHKLADTLADWVIGLFLALLGVRPR